MEITLSRAPSPWQTLAQPSKQQRACPTQSVSGTPTLQQLEGLPRHCSIGGRTLTTGQLLGLIFSFSNLLSWFFSIWAMTGGFLQQTSNCCVIWFMQGISFPLFLLSSWVSSTLKGTIVADASQNKSLTHFQPSWHWVSGSWIFPTCCWVIELEEGDEPEPTNWSEEEGVDFPQQTSFGPHCMYWKQESFIDMVWELHIW